MLMGALVLDEGTTMFGVCSVFFFSSRRRHTRFDCDWSSDVCSSDLGAVAVTVFPYLTKLMSSDRLDLTGDVQRIFNVLLALGCGISAVVLVHADHLEIGRASCRGRV